MQTQSDKYEWLSALADGELARDDIKHALALCDPEDQARWQTYHLIGDALREPSLVRRCDAGKLLEGVRHAVQQDQALRYPAQDASVFTPAHTAVPASNDSVFRWKMVAGVASMAAVAAMGWISFGEWDGASMSGAQLASTAPTVQTALAPSVSPAVSAVQASTGPQVMIRDPRLDELLAAHQQYGRANALQTPAGFLRNATFDTPQQ